jgi:hypothetical protein
MPGVHGHSMRSKPGTRFLRKGLALARLNPSLAPESRTQGRNGTNTEDTVTRTNKHSVGSNQYLRRQTGNLRREIVQSPPGDCRLPPVPRTNGRDFTGSERPPRIRRAGVSL